MSIYQLVKGTRGHDYYRGDDFSQRIIGLGGDDDLGGGGGDDTIFGGKGNDLIEGGRGNDVLSGGEGTDAVSFAYAGDSPDGGVQVDLSTGVAFDFSDGSRDRISGFEVVIGSNYADTLFGWKNDDDLRGGAGGDYLSGAAGNDTLRGDAGDDTIVGGRGFDFVDYFYGPAGTISLRAGEALLGDGDHDTIKGVEGVHGSQGDDTIIGDAGTNELWGEIGDDRLVGGYGDDRLIGGTGSDRLTGGSGTDTMWGGAGADTFAFLAADTWVRSGGGPNPASDTIVDYSHVDGDRIALRAIDANDLTARNDAFHFLGDGTFTGHAGELRTEMVDGNTLVQADRNGDGQSDFTITLLGEHALVAADFVL
jgi:serralysin